jgi:hypothetical protein
MNKNWFLLPLIAMLLVACSQPSVVISSEKMLESGYSSYKTYAFVPTSDTNYGKMINRAVFVPALKAEAIALIEKRGLKLDTINPDCLFTYHLVLARNYDVKSEQLIGYNQQVVSAAAMGSTFFGAMPGVAIGAGSGGVVGGSNVRAGTEIGSDRYTFSSFNRPYSYQGKIQVDTLREGTLVIDMVDAASNRVAWRCVAQGSKEEAQKLPPDVAVKKYLPLMIKKMPRK